MRSLFVLFDISPCRYVAVELIRKCDVIATQLLFSQTGVASPGS
jgi:hypothetical protein